MHEPFTTRALKATALREETLTLLKSWEPGEPAGAFVRRAIDSNLLGKATAARSEDVIRNAFVLRLLQPPDDEPAATLRKLLSRKAPGRWFDAMLLLAAARADATVRASATDFLSATRTSGRSTVVTAALDRFLEEAGHRGRMRRPWSMKVRQGVAQHVLGLFEDFGLLSAPRRGVRNLQAFQAGDLACAWLTCDLHRRGVTDPEIPLHPDWKVWQMPEAEVQSELDRLTRLGLWMYQEAAGVVRFTWLWSNWTEVITRLVENDVG